MPDSALSPVILWFRNDLRLDDHPGVAVALALKRPILPLYIWDETAGARPVGAAARWWLRRSLEALDQDLQKRGSRLIIAAGHSTHVLSDICGKYFVKTVVCSDSFDPVCQESDALTFDHLNDQHIRLEIVNATLFAKPNTLKTKTNNPYRVFTPFGRAMVDQGLAAVDKLPANPQGAFPAPDTWPNSLPVNDLPLASQSKSGLDWASGFTVFTPGERGAKTALSQFIAHGLHDYAEGRDRPDRESVSRLSPHLRFGEISPQRVLYEIDQAARHEARLRPGAAKFRTELLWREFCYGLLAQQPRLDMVNFRSEFNAFPWRDDEAGFRAWTRGETGYPLVDAGMRELWRTGWMHNRVRMVAASFLVKHLLIDWRRGEQWFWDCLVDADPANNPANWQWVAGCGADAAPYFRIFNPLSQAEKFDPQGLYRTHFVPESARKFPGDLFDKPDENRANAAYPAPVVDHDLARRRALQAFEEMRARQGETDDHSD